MSLPRPPYRESFPPFPIKILLPVFPEIAFEELLPVASTSEEPVKVKFSKLTGVIKLTEELMRSVPSPTFSINVSLELITL